MIKPRFRPRSLVAACVCLVTLAFASAPSSAFAQPVWNPGHYVLPARGVGQDEAQLKPLIESLPDYIKGIKVRWYWGQIEQDTAGSYDWSRIDHALSWCVANNKQLVISVEDRNFGGNGGGIEANARAILPDYIVDDPVTYGDGTTSYYEIGGGLGVAAKIYNHALASRYVAMLQALAAHFSTHVDRSHLEAITLGESAAGFSGSAQPADWNGANFSIEKIRIVTEAAPAFSYTNVIAGINFLPGGDIYYNQFLDNLYEHRAGMGGPDIFLNEYTTGQEYLMGKLGTTDYRGKIPVMTDVQGSDWDQSRGVGGEWPTPLGIYTRAETDLRASHIFWSKQNASGDNHGDWEDSLLPFLRDHPHTVSELPANYSPNPLPPGAPFDLAATPGSSTEITLTWIDGSSRETGYIVERAEDAAFTTGLVATPLAANTISLDVTGLAAGVTYHFRVHAFNDVGASPDSDPSSAMTYPPGSDRPEIDVQGRDVSIANGDTEPSTADDTDFGAIFLQGVADHTFAIQNTGLKPLALGTVAIDEAEGSDFSVVAQPAATVAPGESTTFVVRFAPSVFAARSATVTIPNDDGDENPYVFAVKGSVTNVAVFETENTLVGSSGDVIEIRKNPDDVLLHANAVGDYVVFAIPGISAGLFDIQITVQTAKNRGIFQLEIGDSPDGPFVPYGDPVDTYTPGYGTGTVFKVASAVEFQTSGTRYFRFRVLGRNSAASARFLAIDDIKLSRPKATIELGNLSQMYDGTPRTVTFTTSPADLPVSLTYDGAEAAPVNAGTYAVVATIADPRYVGSVSGTLTIAPRPVTIALGNLVQPYDGEPRAVSAAVMPAGPVASVTYDGSAMPPTNPGTYSVVAVVNDGNNVGQAAGTLVVTVTALVRHAPALNGDVDGSVQVLSGENITMNGNPMVSGDLLVPGTPQVQLNGHPTFVGAIDGTGSPEPADYRLTLNGSSVLRYLVRRTSPIDLPAATPPAAPQGVRDVVINTADQSAGDFGTVRNLTLNGNAGDVAVPPGVYGRFVANCSSGFVLGTPGGTEPSVYDLQNLILNGSARLTVAGPVILHLGQGVTFNGQVGDPTHPEWLEVHLAAGNVILNGQATFAGRMIAPASTVTINGGSTLLGSVACDRLVINGQGLLAEP